MAAHARVDLVGTHDKSDRIRSAQITNDRFYFNSVPAGEYLMVATIQLPGRNGESVEYYYPGVTRRDRAVQIRVSGKTSAESFDFVSTDAYPLVPVPFIVDSPDRNHPINDVVLTQKRGGMIITQYRSLTGLPETVFGVRGDPLGIGIMGYEKDERTSQGRCSDKIWTTPVPGMKQIHISLNSRLRPTEWGYCVE
ncbi:MAG TPA: hypothetical protein VN893_08445 [Bryobacteraceae bacterium]|nr:hypothetical protein [Bryobacteraceae bacterium]